MEWEGKIENHKYASLTEEQRRELEGENKRLRLLTPPKSRKETVKRKKQILKLKALREERGITESVIKKKERIEEQEAIIEKQKAKEELDKLRKELGLEPRESQKRKRSEEEEVRNARAQLNLKRIRISMGLENPEDKEAEEGSNIKLISTRIEERAIKRLGEALRAFKNGASQ